MFGDMLCDLIKHPLLPKSRSVFRHSLLHQTAKRDRIFLVFYQWLEDNKERVPPFRVCCPLLPRLVSVSLLSQASRVVDFWIQLGLHKPDASRCVIKLMLAAALHGALPKI